MSKIKEFRGVKDLVYAEVTADTESSYTTGEVKSLAGVASISKETETSSETHYYDNKPAIVIASNGSDKITISVSALDEKVEADITGQDYFNGIYMEGEATPKCFAIGYKTKKTDGSEVYVWRYKGTFSVPKREHNTENDGTDANGQELEFTGISTNYKFPNPDGTDKAKALKGINVEKEKLAHPNTFFAAVVKPADLQIVAG